MNKFGLLDDDEADSSTLRMTSISDRIAAFAPVKPRGSIDLPAIDAAAASHGFVSREYNQQAESLVTSRRRRAVPSEPTRHLAIRLSASAYNRFVAYADRHQLTYHDALIRLLETTCE